MLQRLGAVRTALVGAMTGAVVIATAGTALAVPAPPPNPTDSQITDAAAAQQAAAAEVGRIAGLVAQAESELERYAVQAEAAGTAYEAAVEALQIAQEAADRTAAELQAAEDAVGAAEARISEFSHDTYIDGHTLTSAAVLLDSGGPGELVQRAALLDWVADNQLDVLGELEVARVQQANADSAARAARDQMAAADVTAAGHLMAVLDRSGADGLRLGVRHRGPPVSSGPARGAHRRRADERLQRPLQLGSGLRPGAR